ncbi:MAG: galactokinase, partial [Candidatus Omnitrophica bacterium]|nr:galactokinase [Candidatus Omnitrophota bacterium]
EIDDKPFLDILVQHLKDQGIARVVLCTGHQAPLVESYFSSNPMGIEIEFSREEMRLGTGGALKNAKEKIKSDTFIVMNGDSLCKVDLGEFLEFHKAKQAVASIVVSEVKDVSDFGGIEMNKDLSIAAFREKESVAFGGYVNAGVYCFNKEVFSLMPDQNKFSLEYDLFPKLVNKGIYGFCVDKDFMDIGTPERLEKAKDKLGDLK